MESGNLAKLRFGDALPTPLGRAATSRLLCTLKQGATLRSAGTVLRTLLLPGTRGRTEKRFTLVRHARSARASRSALPIGSASGGVRYYPVSREMVYARLELYTRSDKQREEALKQLFREAGSEDGTLPSRPSEDRSCPM